MIFAGRGCAFDWSKLLEVLGYGVDSPGDKNKQLSLGIRSQLYFPLLHSVGISTTVLLWSLCASALTHPHIAFALTTSTAIAFVGKTPWLLASGFSSGIALNGCAVALADLEHVSNYSRKTTLLLLMYACLSAAPCPFFLLYPGVALPIRVVIPAVVGLSTLLEVWYPSVINVDESLMPRALQMAKSQSSVAWSQLPGAWNFIQTYFKNTDGQGTTFALSCLLATSFALGLDFVGNQWRGMFFDAVQHKNQAKFFSLLRDFCFLAIASVIGGSYSGYLASLWDLHWRQFLTCDILATWFRRHAYFKLSQDLVDNCDQRISEDVREFVSLTRGLGLGSIESLGRLALFLPQLIYTAPPGLWQICLLVSVASSITTHCIGSMLIPNNVALQSAEANFRRSLIRIRDDAEPIALMGTEGRESANCLLRFEELKSVLWSAMQISFRLGAFTSGYSMSQTIFPFILLAPFYFSGQISMGKMFLLEGIMTNVRQGLDFFIVSYGELAQWRATTDRLLHLESAAESITDNILPMEMSHLDVRIPTLSVGDKILLSECRLVIQEGDRVIISGKEGKSTLLLALALIHPCDAVWEARPASEDIQFLPQRPLIPKEPMTLRQLLAFPDEHLTDVSYALSIVGLASWVDKLDKVSCWSTLSTGEAQRIAFARLFCRPLRKWLFLDEPVSHMTAAEAMSMYDALTGRLRAQHTLVTIVRTPGFLRRFHRRFYEIDNAVLLDRT